MISSMLYFLFSSTLCCNGAVSFVLVDNKNSPHLQCWQARTKKSGPLLARPKKAGKRKQDSDDNESMRDASGVNEDLVNQIFNVVQEFGIAEDAIRKVFSKFPQADLTDAAQIGKISSAVCAFSGITEWKPVEEALTKAFVKKDGYKMGKLHGMRIFPDNIFTGSLKQETYVKEAQSYNVAEIDVGETDLRPQNFAVVLGASGAGKSAFALFGLPDLVFQENDSLGILIRAGSVTNGRAYIKRDGKEFGQALCNMIKDITTTEAGNYKSEDYQRLKCPLLVVLDEAANQGPFGNANSIELIASALKDLSEKSSFLVVTGVGLDKVTQHIDSLTEMKKYRMQDWGPETFRLLIRKWNKKESENFAMDLVSSYDSLQSMITNARCAAFLVESMKVGIIRRKIKNTDLYWKTTVAGLLKDVSWKYIATNCLARLSQEQCLKVVRELFLTLEESLKHPKRAFFPRVPKGIDREEKEAWWGFLDINVESKGNKAKFVNENVIGSVSVSPALTLVAAAILDPEGLAPSSDWQGLEEIAAFGEVKQYLVSCKNEFNPGSSNLLLRSKVGYPFVRKRDKEKVPTEIEFPDVIASGMVVLFNGPRASFADVIAPHRVVQLKYTTGETVDIDLRKEFGKMGCTQDEKYVMQQVYLHYLTRAWNHEASNIEVPGQQKRLPLESSKGDRKGGYYPFGQMQSKRKPLANPTLRASRELSKMVWKIQGEAKMGDSSLEIDPSSDLPCKELICAVICTNASIIKLQNGTKIKSIIRADACRLGKLLNEETNKEILEEYKLKKNIEVRFIFC